MVNVVSVSTSRRPARASSAAALRFRMLSYTECKCASADSARWPYGTPPTAVTSTSRFADSTGGVSSAVAITARELDWYSFAKIFRSNVLEASTSADAPEKFRDFPATYASRGRYIAAMGLRVALFSLILLAPTLAYADREDSPFAQGRVRVSGYLGAGSSFNDTYFVFGAGVGYYVVHGLELGAQVDQWFGADPSITRVSPEVRYVIDFVDVVKPYVGGFYRHWFVHDGLADYDTAGGRAGLIFVQGPHLYLSAGVAYERVLNSCEGDNCSYWVPELGAAFAF